MQRTSAHSLLCIWSYNRMLQKQSVIILICLLLLLKVSSCEELMVPVDLTWAFDNKSIYWPNNKPFVFTEKIANDDSGYWYSANTFCAAEHGGTHFDAPYHFNKEGWTVEAVPLSRLIVPGITIDISNDTNNMGTNTTLTVKHIEDWIALYGQIPNNSVLLVRFGWSQYYGNVISYLGTDQKTNLTFPGISKQAAEWIANSGKIAGVGVDTASLDPGVSHNFIVHRTLMKNNIYGMENVNIPENMPARNFTLYIMPMKIKDGSGAPLRIVAAPDN